MLKQYLLVILSTLNKLLQACTQIKLR